MTPVKGKNNDDAGLALKRRMARLVIVVDSTGEERRYPLSIATMTVGADGRVLAVEVEPYEREVAGVEFVPGTLRIDLRGSGS